MDVLLVLSAGKVGRLMGKASRRKREARAIKSGVAKSHPEAKAVKARELREALLRLQAQGKVSVGIRPA